MRKAIELRASYTVEAALVLPVVFLLLVGVILTAYSLHDKVAAKNALICAAELYSHRDENSSRAEEYRETAEQQDIYLSGKQGKISLKAEKITPLNRDWTEGKISGTVTVDGDTLSFESWHLHPETLMRVLTLKDAFRAKQEKDEKNENTENTGNTGNTGTEKEETGK